MQGYGSFEVTGGDGSKIESNVGGGGGAGRIAMHFADNKTFAGSFHAYGGLSDGGHTDGGPGTVFFYHTGPLNRNKKTELLDFKISPRNNY